MKWVVIVRGREADGTPGSLTAAVLAPTPEEAAFAAGRAHREDRRHGFRAEEIDIRRVEALCSER